MTDGLVTQVGTRDAFKSSTATVIDLGDATLLPGFIELHAHLGYQHIPADIVLKHGITTIRDVGGPLHKPYGGDIDEWAHVPCDIIPEGTTEKSGGAKRKNSHYAG